MRTRLLLLLLAAAAAGAAGKVPCGSPAGDWTATCHGYVVDRSAGTISNAVCYDERHNPVQQYWPIVYCDCFENKVSNNNGLLMCVAPAPSPPPPPPGGCGEPSGDWRASCFGYDVDEAAGVIAHAACADRTGAPKANPDFKFCPCPANNVTNDDGTLFCADSSRCGPPGGSWTQSCNGFAVDEYRGAIYRATCQAPSPFPPVTTDEFDYCERCPRPIVISNNNGNLKC